MVEIIDENEMTQENRLSEIRMGAWSLENPFYLAEVEE